MDKQGGALVEELKEASNATFLDASEAPANISHLLLRASEALAERTVPAVPAPGITDAVALGVIAAQIEWWLSHNADQHRREGREPFGAMHVIPPTWPTRTQLSRWIGHLKRAAQALETSASSPQSTPSQEQE